MGASGTVVADFGVFPGASDVVVAVVGQAGIVASSLVEAWVCGTAATADHSEDEHVIETIDCQAFAIVTATGFSIRVFNTNQISEREPAQLYEQGNPLAGQPRGPHHSTAYSEGRGTRLYGQWTIAWVWN
ncbi:MAG: hypothetical protein ACRD1X_17940 [Vicinamibacteria bacterium]